MKYPRIHSLSTLGLIHHQKFDFSFHPKRTDFNGESGSGKSMITDLIQLIFIGSKYFVSPTRATEKRDPNGMVLPIKEGGAGHGYAFLNILLGPSQYVVIGTYLESTRNEAVEFVIQNGYNWNQLDFLSSPITSAILEKNGEILPIEELKLWLSDNHLVFKSFERNKSEYREILFRHGITPLKLSEEEKTVKAYAEILQAFSRGNSLNIKDGESLKQFLFGNSKAREVWEKFEQAEKDLQDNSRLYHIHVKDIEMITEKQKSLKNLRLEMIKRDEALKIWLGNLHYYWASEKDRVKREFDIAVLDFTKASLSKDWIQEYATETQAMVQPKLEKLHEHFNDLGEEILRLKSRNKDVEKVQGWADFFECSPEEIKLKFERTKKIMQKSELSKSLSEKLRQDELNTIFSEFANEKTFDEFKSLIDSNIYELSNEIDLLEKLNRFSDPEDSNSLVNWALRLDRNLTIEEESWLVAFQELSLQKGEMTEDFISNPKELFESLQNQEPGINGFWIYLSGLKRHIKYSDHLLFNKGTADEIKAQFSKWRTGKALKIKDLTQRKKSISRLKNLFDGLESPKSSFEAATTSEVFKYPTDFLMSAEAFNTILIDYEERVSIRKQLQDKELQQLGLTVEKGILESEIREIDQVTNCLSSIAIPSLSHLLIEPNSKIEDIDIQRNLELTHFKSSRNKVDFAYEIKSTLGNSVKIQDLKNKLDEATRELEDANQKYLKFFVVEPLVMDKLLSKYSIDQLGVDYQTIEGAYQSSFHHIVEQYPNANLHQFKEDKNLDLLAKALVPKAFEDVLASTDKEDPIEQIERLLNQLNNENLRIGEIKLQKIREVLHEVEKAISEMTTHADDISKFLKRNGSISGGYKAKLALSVEGGISVQWLKRFRSDMGFIIGKDEFVRTEGKNYEMQNIMISYFRKVEIGKSAGVTIQRLLDPTEYFDLSYSMMSDSGRKNTGSTGQTYAAMALLCIARLSLIGKTQKKDGKDLLRIMPIDEAEGLGSNFDNLEKIAENFDYQLMTFSVSPIGRFREGCQYVYFLHKNMEVSEPVNHPPMAIFSEKDYSSLAGE